jgi:hypothetical protein
MKSVDINGVTVSVENTDRYTTDNRSIFEWTIMLDGGTYSEADLKSGCGAEPSETEMLETLLAFLGAAAESYRYDGMEGENSHLFPEPVVKWASDNEDEISYVQCGLQDTLESEQFNKDYAKKMREVAYEWHSGMWSPLYAFASSGRCDDKGALLGEIDINIGLKEVDLQELHELRDFVESLEYDKDVRAWLAPWYDE